MSAFLSVPAACIARKRGDHHRHPALVVAGARARAPSSPSRTQRWNGESGSNTVSRWPISSSRLPRRCPCGGRRCGRRARRRFMSIHSTLKPSGSSSAREHVADRLDPGEVQRPAVLVDPFLEHGDVRACSASTVADHRLLGRAQLGGGGGRERSSASGGEGQEESRVHATQPSEPHAMRVTESSGSNALSYSIPIWLVSRDSEPRRRRVDDTVDVDALIDALIEREGGYVEPSRRQGRADLLRDHRGGRAGARLCRADAPAAARRSGGDLPPALLAAAALRRDREAQRRASPPSCSTPAPTWARRSPRPSSSAR